MGEEDRAREQKNPVVKQTVELFLKDDDDKIGKHRTGIKKTFLRGSAHSKHILKLETTGIDPVVTGESEEEASGCALKRNQCCLKSFQRDRQL